jgi:uncharacterized coiled-coil protein SlyX
MTDKALRLAEELEKRVAVVSDKYNDERFCVLGQDEAIEAFHETVTDHWLEIERLATDAASLIRAQQEEIGRLRKEVAHPSVECVCDCRRCWECERFDEQYEGRSEWRRKFSEQWTKDARAVLSESSPSAEEK